MIQANGQAAQRFLGPPRTADYKPSLVAPLPLWSGHDTTWYSWYDVEWMRRDSQCQFGLRVLRAPLATVTWEIPASAPEVAAWVDRTLRKVWTRYLNKVTAYLEYGSCGGEVTWRYDRGSDLIELNELLDLHVLDMKPLQQSRKQVGVRVKSSLGDMAPADLFAPRYWWIANEPEFGAYHGRARLAGAWIPWQEKTARHGARDVRRTWYVKCVMDGGTLYVPPGTTEVDVGVYKSNMDYGRELMEKVLAGGVMVLPNVTDEKGKRLWEREPPKINGELTGIHTLIEELDVEIIVGMGIPPEVVQAADTGSGWSGRSVPFLVFLTSEDQLADTTVQAIDRHILRPGVAVNFGEDARYEIRLKSLVKQAEEDEAKKQGQAPGAKPGETAAQGQEQKAGPPQGQGQAPGRPQGAVRMSVQHAPPGGVTIGGKDFVGGEFIPADVVEKATPEEKAKLEDKTPAGKKRKSKAKPKEPEKPKKTHAQQFVDTLTDLAAALEDENAEPADLWNQAQEQFETAAEGIRERMRQNAEYEIATLEEKHGDLAEHADVENYRKNLQQDLDDHLIYAMQKVAEAYQAMATEMSEDGEVSEDTREEYESRLEGLEESRKTWPQIYVERIENDLTGPINEAAAERDKKWEEEASNYVEGLQERDDDGDSTLADEVAREFNKDLKDSGNPFRLVRDENGEWTFETPDEDEEESKRQARLSLCRACRAVGVRPADVARLSIQHAPPGGVTIAGQDFAGGEFIPGDVLAKATPEEKAALQGQEKQPTNSLEKPLGGRYKHANMREFYKDVKNAQEKRPDSPEFHTPLVLGVEKRLHDLVAEAGRPVESLYVDGPEKFLFVAGLKHEVIVAPVGNGVAVTSPTLHGPDRRDRNSFVVAPETPSEEVEYRLRVALGLKVPSALARHYKAADAEARKEARRKQAEGKAPGKGARPDARLDKVRSALEELPGSGAARKPPFETTDPYEPSPYAGQAFGEARDKEWPIQDVPVKDLIARQDTVTMPDVLRHAATPEGERKPIMLVKKDGKLYIHDGTNRAAAAKLAGDKTIKAKVIDLDQ